MQGSCGVFRIHCNDTVHGEKYQINGAHMQIPDMGSRDTRALEKIRSVPITRVQITTYITDVSAERHALAPTLKNASETL